MQTVQILELTQFNTAHTLILEIKMDNISTHYYLEKECMSHS